MNRNRKKSQEQETFKALDGRQKLQYIWDYYKLPLAVLCIFLYIIGYSLYGHFTHKETLLCTALVNVSAGEALTEQLNTGFLDFTGADRKKEQLELYTGLYLTDDENSPYHEYTYASRMKILAAINNKELDVVLMNKEAFDSFSQNGYLCNLEELLAAEDTALYNQLKPYLITNTIILEDNSVDTVLDPSVAYEAVTEEYPVGLDLSQTGRVSKAGFDDAVYLGIVSNSLRKDAAVNYIRYLTE
ncbi:MAG: hypothetical protein MR966_11935 [Lachnospiraceae bacterium]|nr:hypothetical protein [Lachnospiraceae bacterium]